MASNQQDGPRETAAGLQHGNEDPAKGEDAPVDSPANPATQQNMVDDRSNPDEQSTRAKAQRHGKVTSENWNQ